jgi:hypothetical protein
MVIQKNILWRRKPPKNIFLDADFVAFAKQNEMNKIGILKNFILLPKAAKYFLAYEKQN